MKKFLSIVAVFGVVSVLGGCNGDNSKYVPSSVSTTENSNVNSVDSGFVAELESAVEKLKNLQSSYIVETAIEDNTGIFTYIEVTANGNNYTEYPLDDEGNLGTVSYGSSDEMSYVLIDSLMSDGSFYSFDEAEDGTTMHRYPKSYGSIVDGRKTLYVEDMLDSIYDIEKLDDKMSVTLSGSEMGLTMYSAKLKSEKVNDILTVSNIGVYESLIADEEDGSNVAKLCENYLKDYEFIMVFSDANVMIGVDDSGLLRYMGMEIGGLGQRMYYTKVLVADNNQNIRELPDTSGACDLRDDFVDTADYVAGFDSYEDAMKSLSLSNSTEVTTEIESIDESSVIETESIDESTIDESISEIDESEVAIESENKEED